VLRGRVPYRDFHLEYPPGALPVFVVPSALSGAGKFALYSRFFEGLMGICGIAVSAAVASIVARRTTAARRLVAPIALVSFGTLALGPVALSRFDLWPAALTVAALAALVADRRRLAFALLALGSAAKVFPAFLLPAMLIYVWRRNGRRQAILAGGAFVAVALAALAPFLALAPDGVWQSITGQASRPLQIESLGASFLLAAHQVSGLGVAVVSSHGSDNLVGAFPHTFSLVLAAVQLLVIVGLWVVFARGVPNTDRLFRTCAGTVCAFIAFGKVLSPQYLVWLIPLVALVRGRRGVFAGGLLLVAMVLTQLWFPYRYIDLVYALDPLASWLVLARDLVLVGLLVVLVWPDRRGPTPSRSRRRVSLDALWPRARSFSLP
jgi:uncharacterized membrane protein